MLSDGQIDAYRRDGFIVVEGVLSADEVAALRRATDDIVAGARSGHRPRRRLRPGAVPHARRSRGSGASRRLTRSHEVYDRVMRHERILAILRQLLGPAIRYDTSKLNMKSPGYGAAVEWHQDWAFYPHTNDDLCAVGVMMDDCGPENGPLLCLPGSHAGPIHDHHSDGAFCGAIDPVESGIDFGQAVACTGPAGSISIHHVRTVHGSATNTSDRPRRLLLYQYCAADAWPLTASHQPADWAAWRSRLLCGDPDLVAPRMTAVPVRLPLPEPKRPGSIYETQRELKNSYFAPPFEPRAA